MTRDDKLLLLPMAGTSSNWYKDVLENPAVKVGVAGLTVTARAKPISHKEEVSEVVELFKGKYGASEIKKYYTKLDVAIGVKLT